MKGFGQFMTTIVKNPIENGDLRPDASCDMHALSGLKPVPRRQRQKDRLFSAHSIR